MTHQFKWRTIHALLSLKKVPDEERGWKSFNVAPTQQIPVVRTTENHDREIVEMRWGLIPSWAQDRKIGSRMINARGETVHAKPAFRSAFKRRRCVILASGFYEWKRDPKGGKSQPFLLQRTDGDPLLLAGLWESWTDRETGEVVESCAIITTTANADVEAIHDRMPVILEVADALKWLDEKTASDELLALMRPAKNRTLQSHEVSSKVNSPKNNDASLVKPVAAA